MYGSPRSYMTDRQGLTWQQTFFKRVMNLSAVRWFCSLLNEQWWRERAADGLVTELRVMQVLGHRVAGLVLEEDFSGVWVVEIVEEVGLMTCERSVIGQKAKLLNWRSAQGMLLRWSQHGIEMVEVKVQEEEVEDRERERRNGEQSEGRRENTQPLKRMTHGWDDAHQHLSQCGMTHH